MPLELIVFFSFSIRSSLADVRSGDNGRHGLDRILEASVRLAAVNDKLRHRNVFAASGWTAGAFRWIHRMLRSLARATTDAVTGKKMVLKRRKVCRILYLSGILL